ncbi:MAG: hypothetical protein KZQ89_15780 [Candidatus Thiodiazotropha sp. (ex Lucinoma kastoroae)]|nr:hypothetical protein [Candidatus Thiodiazotropha sp. (ex Rostrolucina anterorostrata)]MCU7849414.1 hypothetical protein [Candidatus Thiodiazotropha sp. (ex Lucinoma kastoroae)]MCU7861367.1 hypothetical protein [Candidatus Thiodiazotropha sp. (ex Lucinoma kastoroae)]
MFKKIFGGNSSPRVLNDPGQLLVGDIVSLKQRRSLPDELQGEQLEVTKVGGYQYSATEITKELTLRSADNKTYYLSVDDNDGDPLLCFSIKLPEPMVLTLFDEEEFSQLWGDDFVTLMVREKPEELLSWLADSYTQRMKEGEAYYYNHDCGGKIPEDDAGEELRYHECVGNLDARYLSVEIWGEGDTDVSLAALCPVDAIEEMWPGEQ